MEEHTWRILLVDDDPDDYVLTRDLLADSNRSQFSLHWAASLESAWNALSMDHYDAVLVDYRLGARTGVELVQEASARGYPTPMILFTGHGTHAVDLEAMHAGAMDFLEKGEVTPPLLERAIRYAVERKQAVSALEEARSRLELRVQERTQGLQQAKERLERANQELEESEARFRTVFEEAALGIALKDLQGRILASNPALQEMLGFTTAELRNKRFDELTHPDDVEAENQLFARLAHGGIDRYRLEKRYLCKDGSPLWARLAVSLIKNEAGQPQFALFMVENIHEQKQMQAELAEVRQRLIDSREDERMELARDLHDGPMQELYGAVFEIGELQSEIAELMAVESRRPGAAWSSQLAEIREHIQGTIQSLRTFSSALRPPALAPFGLEAALSAHAETYRQEHPEIELELELQPDAQALPERIRLALFRIYQHSMANVARHSGAKRVIVRFAFDNKQARLEIEDNGRGFEVPPGWIDFVRAGHLGLAGASERAEAIGGLLEVQSAPGQGTRLRVLVPANLA